MLSLHAIAGVGNLSLHYVTSIIYIFKVESQEKGGLARRGGGEGGMFQVHIKCPGIGSVGGSRYKGVAMRALYKLVCGLEVYPR